jgi:hypothetical protein
MNGKFLYLTKRRNKMALILKSGKHNEEDGNEDRQDDGMNTILDLVEKLMADNRYEDIVRIKTDPSYREKLCEEYHISY